MGWNEIKWVQTGWIELEYTGMGLNLEWVGVDWNKLEWVACDWLG